MASTTIKLSTETRDRIKAMGGDTYEDTIVEALDALEAEQFWAQAAQAAAWRRSQPEGRRRLIAEREAAVDQAFDAIG
jgi:predicted transcriptional regulator